MEQMEQQATAGEYEQQLYGISYLRFHFASFTFLFENPGKETSPNSMERFPSRSPLFLARQGFSLFDVLRVAKGFQPELAVLVDHLGDGGVGHVSRIGRLAEVV